MSLLLLICCISCSFMAGIEYSNRGTLEYKPAILVMLLSCAFVLGVILIGYLAPEPIWID